MTMQDVLISPKYKLSAFDGNPSLDDKITIFEDRIKGWFLDVAERVLALGGDGFRWTDFSVLAILAVYFEMIAQYQSDRDSDRSSRLLFCTGIQSVFPDRYNEQQQHMIYKSLRCALYHNGLTKGAVVGRDHQEAFHFEEGLVWINPTSLLQAIRQHFTDYIAQLKNPVNTTEHQRFQTIYDANPKL